jgi:hypothetical protein
LMAKTGGVRINPTFTWVVNRDARFFIGHGWRSR